MGDRLDGDGIIELDPPQSKVVVDPMATSVRANLIVAILLAALLMAAVTPALAAKQEPEMGANEIKMGDEAAVEVAKEYKLSSNAADLKRIREMGEKIAAVANSKEISALYGSSRVTPFEYKFNIIEDSDVNAFSVPGGHIYVYRGLLDFVQSDQELAAVIAHEITHASHHHMVYLLSRQASLNNQMAIALLATMIGGARSADLGNVLLGVQLFQIAKLNGYGMQAERDADRGAILYMIEAGYNPVGLLTFLERLAKRPELVDYGIYRSHPLDADRVAAAKKLIQDLGLPLNRRETTNAVKAEVKSDKVNGVEAPGVYIKDKVIYRPAPANGKTSEQIARETAGKINKALDAGIQMHELKADKAGAGVVVRNQALLVVSAADAELMGKTPDQVAQGAAAAIRDVVWKQMVDTIH